MVVVELVSSGWTLDVVYKEGQYHFLVALHTRCEKENKDASKAIEL